MVDFASDSILVLLDVTPAGELAKSSAGLLGAAAGVGPLGVRIGGDGYGYNPVIGADGSIRIEKIPQIGVVELGDDVDLSALSLSLGFTSHSHFSAAFRHAYGRSPTEFRQAG